jgi:hypothetical protein
LSLLSQIYIREWACYFVGPPRFHFDETNCSAIERDNVDLARDLRAARISANRNGEIRHHDPIAFAFKKPSCQALARFS